jgi:hypothetical protein
LAHEKVPRQRENWAVNPTTGSFLARPGIQFFKILEKVPTAITPYLLVLFSITPGLDHLQQRGLHQILDRKAPGHHLPIRLSSPKQACFIFKNQKSWLK